MPHATATVAQEPVRIGVALGIFAQATAEVIAGAVGDLAVGGQESVAALAITAARLIIAVKNGAGQYN